ncbi:MAG: methyltransferase domain-containing protein [Desulfofustis sp. PB-SRB1]|jgi:hypothetical protein|nr:methyltransferase domain-containing protein [Desulfofustis sp. PB-SRB1]MBM1003551.1 methyltransferase domain-containing protein [Desulfofustis sp. PB-SRB1]HBH28335.1 methyltransferase domain-containing protein [Desulfofustis sp.]HBH30553.1 methyltransferase domain-containing protein [Desulfofustis sp.]
MDDKADNTAGNSVAPATNRRLTGDGTAEILFSLRWLEGAIRHCCIHFGQRVSMWRDIFPPAIYDQLVDREQSAEATSSLTESDFHAPYDNRLLIALRAEQFQPVIRQNGQQLTPQPGRFYPQGFLRGVPGIFASSTAAARFVGHDRDRLVFDLNHPLAGHALHVTARIEKIVSAKTERGGRCEHWLETMSAAGPGMQCRYQNRPTHFFDAPPLPRIDERPDGQFYHQPRLVHHLDERARLLLSNQYGDLIETGADVLDLMASWESHLPESLAVSSLTVVGLNEVELHRNPRATNHLVHDLNELPLLPLADAACDVIICTASIEYLIDPVAVLKEAGRLLRPGGTLIISFSNRWFAPKTITLWPELHECERLGFVRELLEQAGCFTIGSTTTIRGYPRPEDDPYPELPHADPLFIITAHKK